MNNSIHEGKTNQKLSICHHPHPDDKGFQHQHLQSLTPKFFPGEDKYEPHNKILFGNPFGFGLFDSGLFEHLSCRRLDSERRKTVTTGFPRIFYYSNEFFNTDGDRKDLPLNGDFRDYNLNYYMEFGLRDRLTLLTSLYYKYLKYEDDTLESKSYGISDIDLGMRYGICDNDLGVFSVQGTGQDSGDL